MQACVKDSTHLDVLLRNNPYKDIPRIPESRLQEISDIARITEVEDFDPNGDSHGKSHKWPFISKAVLIRDNYSCRVCGRSDLSTFSTADHYDRIHLAVQVHHITPRKNDGRNTFRNLVTLCEECHRKTFSNDHAGLPVDGQMTIYGFDFSVTLCINEEWIREGGISYSRGELHDYVRAYDESTGSYRLIARKGESLPITVADLDRGQYRRVCEAAAGESDAADYVTLVASTELGKKKVRFFLNSQGKLLV